MFLEFYGMREQPFGDTPDPRFLFLGPSHREALASLICGFEANRGFIALIAYPGLGKTTLTFQLLEKLQHVARTVFLFHTQCTSRELLQYVLNDLEVDSNGMDMVSMHKKLNEVLAEERRAGRRFVLAIDEAQNLTVDTLETIRLLSNFEVPRAKLLQILLIGQPQLAHKLADPSLMQLRQRINALARLEPFNSEETSLYIDHRLKVAGYSGNSPFTPDALRMIAEESAGVPRNINNLCFSALSLGFATAQRNINADMIREVVADLDVASLGQSPIRLRDSYNSNTKAQTSFGQSPIRLRDSNNSHTKAQTSLTDHWSWLNKGDQAQDFFRIAKSTNDTASNSTTNTIDVVVRTGETLCQIMLRVLGEYNNDLIRQVQTLNADMGDPDHIEVNQRIRLPLTSKALRTRRSNVASNIVDRN